MNAPPLGRLVLVFGKGGVGKSTVAEAIARGSALRGRACALVGFGDADASAVDDGVERIALDADSAIARAAVPLFRSAVVTRIVLANFAIKRLARAAPVLRELALLECVRQIAAARPSAVVVVDMPATGHGVAWLRAPRQVLALLPRGPARRFVEEVEHEVNGTHASSVVVTLPEPLALRETVELCHSLRDVVGKPPAWIIVNRMPRACADEALVLATALLDRIEPAGRPAAVAMVGAIASRSRAWDRARSVISSTLAGEAVAWSTIPEMGAGELADVLARSFAAEAAA